MVPADRYMLVQSNARGGDSRVGHRRQNPNHTRRRRASNKAGFTHLARSSDRQTALSKTPISGDRRGALRSDAPRQWRRRRVVAISLL